MVDQQLAKSFESIGEEYDRYRPGFPDAAADAILPERVNAVLDLGAGTGKFTELLVERADRVIAIEPSVAMLDVLRAKLPAIETRVAGAEDIPLDRASVDAVTVAQAFHWFDRDPACAEIRRVLKPGGVLGLLWNHSDPSCAWDYACHRIATPPSVRATRRRMPRLMNCPDSSSNTSTTSPGSRRSRVRRISHAG
ncbi:methyltransferase domain-containing protein [uncultured Microbacterium sp.]|uniref:class I SAM-dependent methyltransferase n=1 Tax=uncultured Microbacterium sp. TaxID=191216 RepID=UPI0026288CA7|nr:methyltransferase domain-containing protein [uncultured Microbacterium sp.]